MDNIKVSITPGINGFIGVIAGWLEIPLIRKVSIILIGLVIIYILVKITKRPFNKYISNNELRYRTKKAITFIGYVLGFLLIGAVLSDKIGSFMVVFGVASAGIAFALQEVIISFAGWLAISFGNFFNVGDRIRLGNVKGDVIDIGLIRTTVMEIGDWVQADQYNGKIVRIANNFVFKEPVYNYSGDFPFLWDEINVPIKYGSDYELARELLYRTVTEVIGDYVPQAREKWRHLVKKYMIENASVEPMVIMEANDNWVTFTVRYVVDYKLRRTTRDKLFAKILNEIGRTDGRVKVASATLELVGVPDIKVINEGG